ncbi:flavodoxin family protein, partial [Streptomyces phytophilus]|uniref:flavodoxin family protein n=1 Tax=Streptomyces phytophilus TaxID=722715 RepID=UPI0015F02BAC
MESETPVRAAVIYYSAGGTVHALALAAAEGAEKAGAEVRLRRVPETARNTGQHTAQDPAQDPAQRTGQDPAQPAVPDTAEGGAAEVRPGSPLSGREAVGVPEAAVGDLDWADVVLFGTPTRLGSMSAPVKAFIETTGPLGSAGGLADKVYSAFTSSGTARSGSGAGLLALVNVFCHWGGVI